MKCKGGRKADVPIGFGLELQDLQMCLWCFYLFIYKKLCLKKGDIVMIEGQIGLLGMKIDPRVTDY